MKKNRLFAVTVSLMLAASMALTGCQGNSGSKGSQLIVSTWGLGEDTYRENTIVPFEKANSASVVLETGTTAERSTKLQSNPNSTIDIIELNQAEAAKCLEAGVIEAVDVTALANFKDLIPSAQTIAESGIGIPYTTNVLGIIYNKEAAGMEINEWSDLWDPSLAKKIAIPEISSTFGPAMVHIASDYKGMDVAEDQGAKAFEALEELKPNIVKTYSKSSDLANLFASGEICVAVIGDFGVETVQKADATAEFVIPEEGTYGNCNVICVTKNTKNKDLAVKWADWRISKDCQTVSAELTSEVPINTTVDSSVVEKLKGEGFMDKLQNAKFVDYTVVNPLLAGWTDSWNRIIND